MIDAERLEAFARAVFARVGLPPEDAATVAHHLVYADLRGVETHGVVRIPAYVERLRRGLVNPRPNIAVEGRTPWSMAIDGDNGMGPVVGARAMHEVLTRAHDFGIGAATVRRSNHFGAAGSYAALAPAQGCIGICLSPASRSLAPYGSREPFFGTNPIAVAVPAGRRAPWVMDMATSVAARGHIRLAVAAGRSIPEGWALDRDGRPTTDAAAALQGVMLPFAGPKGSALTFLADILGGVLAGAAFGGEVRDMNTDFAAPQDVGHFFLALRIDAFIDPELFAERMDDLISRLKSLPPAEGFTEVTYPGEREARRAAERRAAGIPLSDSCLAALRRLAAELDVALVV